MFQADLGSNEMQSALQGTAPVCGVCDPNGVFPGGLNWLFYIVVWGQFATYRDIYPKTPWILIFYLWPGCNCRWGPSSEARRADCADDVWIPPGKRIQYVLDYRHSLPLCVSSARSAQAAASKYHLFQGSDQRSLDCLDGVVVLCLEDISSFSFQTSSPFVQIPVFTHLKNCKFSCLRWLEFYELVTFVKKSFESFVQINVFTFVYIFATFVVLI